MSRDKPLRLGIVGVGKIARDQHIPVVRAHPEIELRATADPGGGIDAVANFPSQQEMLDACPEINAVALCMPPQRRYPEACLAIDRGKHLLLEKPPAATLAEMQLLQERAKSAGVTAMAAWHSRHAAAVEPARRTLLSAAISSVDIVWREDVRHWHPGQTWIWQPGGMGVFDAGINALSIATCILPWPLLLQRARLEFPANRQAPIAAVLDFRSPAGALVHADLDWRESGPQQWHIKVTTGHGVIRLGDGGTRLEVDDQLQPVVGGNEYRAVYDRLVELVESGKSDFDISPMMLVADAFLLGERKVVAPYEE